MQTNLTELRQPSADSREVVVAGFGTASGFDLLQRVSKAFAGSNIVPGAYQGNLPNCLIAVNMAMRMQADPLMVMQNLYLVHNRPSWSSQFLIACWNQCGRYTSIRYEIVGTPGSPEYGCRAISRELRTNELLIGPTVTLAMAKAEGWSTRSGSKWITMPDLMLRYRAAAFLVRTYAPEIAMGLPTREELADVLEADVDDGVMAVRADQLSDVTGAAEEAPTKPQAATDAPAEAAPEPPSEPPAKGKRQRQATPEPNTVDNTDDMGVSSAQVETALLKSSSLDTLDIAADLIDAVSSEEERAHLKAIFQRRRAELSPGGLL